MFKLIKNFEEKKYCLGYNLCFIIAIKYIIFFSFFRLIEFKMNLIIKL